MSRANAVVTVTPPPPTPDDGDALYLYVADGESYDSNLYRLAPGVDPATAAAPNAPGVVPATKAAPNAARADFFTTAFFGGEGQYLLGRQVFDLDARIDEQRFSRNDLLNNTAGDGKLVWNWVVGSTLTGHLGAGYARGLASFAETLFLVARNLVARDLVAATRYFGDLRYQLGPHWALYGGADDTDSTHSLQDEKFNDQRVKSGNGGLEYDAGAGDTFALDYRYSKGDYMPENGPKNVLVNRDYRDGTGRFVAHYAVSEKSEINGYVGYLRREYVEQSIGRFAGTIWRLSADWRPTEKTDLVAATWHELHAYTASEADYFVARGFSVSPVWNFSEKLTFSAVASYEHQDYIASSTSVLLNAGGRTDQITAEQINLLYTPRKNWFVNVFFRNERRGSTVPSLDYNDQSVNMSLAYRFW